MRDGQPGVSHFIARSAAAIHPLIRVRVVRVVSCVVVPLLQYQHRSCWHQRRDVRLINVTVMPCGTPIRDLADFLCTTGFRIEDLQRCCVHTQMPVGLETVESNWMVKAVKALSHLISVRRNNQIILLLNPVQGKVLLVDIISRFVVIFMKPQTDLYHVIFDHGALRCRANAARKHVNAPLNHCALRQSSADPFWNHFAPFTHSIFCKHAITLKFAFFVFHPDT